MVTEKQRQTETGKHRVKTKIYRVGTITVLDSQEEERREGGRKGGRGRGRERARVLYVQEDKRDLCIRDHTFNVITYKVREIVKEQKI